MPNPFYHAGYIKDPAQFVGRRAELGRIFGALETAHSGQLQSISVVGPRRIGRSSLLYHLTQVYRQHLSHPEGYLFAYVDLESGPCQTLPGLLRTIWQRLLERLPAGEGRKELEGEVTLAHFEEAIKGLDCWPVVCLDEFEQLVERQESRAEFPLGLYDSWRSLMSGSHMALVTASQVPLDRLSAQKKLTSPFFNVFTYLPLGEFTPEEARALVDRGRTCDRPFSDQECERILRLAGRHPYCLQVASSLVYQAKAGGRPVNWMTVRRDYGRQVAPVLAEVPCWRRALNRLDSALQTVGRFVLHLLRRPTEDEAILRMTGLVTVAVIILIALGIVGLDTLRDWLKLLLGG